MNDKFCCRYSEFHALRLINLHTYIHIHTLTSIKLLTLTKYCNITVTLYSLTATILLFITSLFNTGNYSNMT